jgi:hypothetical protein
MGEVEVHLSSRAAGQPQMTFSMLHANFPDLVWSFNMSSRPPRRDPYAVSSRFGTGVDTFFNHEG